jgi:hypothetical protein
MIDDAFSTAYRTHSPMIGVDLPQNASGVPEAKTRDLHKLPTEPTNKEKEAVVAPPQPTASVKTEGTALDTAIALSSSSPPRIIRKSARLTANNNPATLTEVDGVKTPTSHSQSLEDTEDDEVIVGKQKVKSILGHIPKACGYASLRDHDLRKEIAAGAYMLLRQIRASLRPWKWHQGVTSTNALIDKTVCGTCAFLESNPPRVLEQGKDM